MIFKFTILTLLYYQYYHCRTNMDTTANVVVNIDSNTVDTTEVQPATEPETHAPAHEPETQEPASMCRTLGTWLLKYMTCVLLMIWVFFSLGLGLCAVAVCLAAVLYICGCVNF
jgi:hypothetical protein